MNPSRIPALEDAHQRIKVHKGLIDDDGRKKLLKKLTESEDPYQSITEIQASWSLTFPRAQPALAFLDNVLECSRSSVYQGLLETMKAQLDLQLSRMTDENKLLLMLQETIGYMGNKDLKSVPISIIKRLSVVPEKYLNILAKKGQYNPNPTITLK